MQVSELQNGSSVAVNLQKNVKNFLHSPCKFAILLLTSFYFLTEIFTLFSKSQTDYT